jgi:hypothetical protein
VLVNRSISETLVLAKDSSGRLWITWTENGKVKINRTMGNDLTWGTPFDLPVQGNGVTKDDISTILAFGGNKIGVMWSNQNDKTTYFAVHRDGNADLTWETREEALRDPALGAVSYDHINMKPSCDNDGNIYAATKTSLSQSRKEAPHIFVLKRTPNGAWTRYVYGNVGEAHTRPIVLIDGEHRKLYVFAMSDAVSPWVIYMKSADLDNINFAPGLGTPFISSDTDSLINNPTSTKQCLSGKTGLLVLASDQNTRHYFHNYLDLGGDQNQYNLTVSAAGAGRILVDPSSETYPAHSVVTLTAMPDSGFQFNGWSGDLIGFANPATITLEDNKKVTAILHQQYHQRCDGGEPGRARETGVFGGDCKQAARQRFGSFGTGLELDTIAGAMFRARSNRHRNLDGRRHAERQRPGERGFFGGRFQCRHCRVALCRRGYGQSHRRDSFRQHHRRER